VHVCDAATQEATGKKIQSETGPKEKHKTLPEKYLIQKKG
jgi:hypothetical protein